MAKLLGIFVCLALLSIFASEASASKRMVCYFGSWSVYRKNGGKFDVEDIDPTLCTHLNYGFVGLSAEPGIRILDPWNDLYDDYGKGAFTRFVNLKNRNPSAKVLVAIGGWNEGSVKYSQALATASGRATFTRNAIAFIQKYKFDGLDLDWEYPGQRGGLESDKQVFTELLKTMRTEFDKHGYLLTAAVASAEVSFMKSYEVQALNTYLDFINVMTYDFHGAWETITGHNAPLYGSPLEIGTDTEGFNVDDSINAWLRHGASPDKLVMGVGLYGRSFTLASTSCAVPRCPISAPGWAGPTTAEKGIMGYSEICAIESTSILGFDEEAKVPYLVNGDQWVGYDNMRSIQMKVDYILSKNLGGGMVWSVDTDDHKGLCGNGRFPLLSLLSYGVRHGVSNPSPTTTAAPSTTTTTTTQAPTTASTTTQAPVTTASTTTQAPVTTASTTTQAPVTTASTTTQAPVTTASTTTQASSTTSAPASSTTAAPANTTPCTGEGYIRDPLDCKVFYLCTLNKSVYSYSKFTCSGTLVFDTTRNVCNYPQNVVC